MGRDMYWYILPKTLEHDTTKKLCFQYEFQEDDEIVISQVYERMTNESSQFDFKNIDEEESCKMLHERIVNFRNNVEQTAFEYMCNDDAKELWCPKCSMFANGISSSGLVMNKIHIRHSYSNSYWTSSWNIQNLFLGTSYSSFICLFKNDCMLKEVTQYHVQLARKQIEYLGAPLRTSDKEACEETKQVLDFLDKWIQNEDVIVIMEDEY